jgi:hypothetical protein
MRNSRLKRRDLIFSFRVYRSLSNWVEGAGIEFAFTTWGQADFDDLGPVADGMCSDVRAAEGGGDELAGGPVERDLDSSAGAKAGDLSVGPCCGKCGQKVNLISLRLKEHLCEAGGSCGVSVE